MMREYFPFPSYGKVLFLAQETSFLYAEFTTTPLVVLLLLLYFA